MKKLLFSILAAAFLLTGVVTYARACDLPMATVEQLVKETPELKIVDLTEPQQKTLVDNMGPPPNTNDQPFTVKFLIYDNGLARLLVVQDGCIVTHAGPAPLDAFLRKAGITEANG